MDYDRDAVGPSVMLVADGEGAPIRARATARQAGLVVAADLDVAGATALDDAALRADLLFLELGADRGTALDRLIERIGRLASGGQAAILSIVPELIDMTIAGLGDAPVDILCSTDPAERIAAVAMVLARRGKAVRQDDAGGEDPLRAIGEDLGRIAARLLGMAERRATAALPAPTTGEGDAGIVVTAADYRRMLRDRRLRDIYLGEGLFADPAWDMLLDLAAARIEESPVAVSSLCIAAAVPPTTALRWIQALTERGMLLRVPDPQDGRRVFVILSPPVVDAMAAYVRATKGPVRG